MNSEVSKCLQLTFKWDSVEEKNICTCKNIYIICVNWIKQMWQNIVRVFFQLFCEKFQSKKPGGTKALHRLLILLYFSHYSEYMPSPFLFCPKMLLNLI